VTLWVLASNRNAIAFYEALGFMADDAQKTEKLPDGTELCRGSADPVCVLKPTTMWGMVLAA